VGYRKFVAYYENIFNNQNHCIENGLVASLIPSLVDHQMNVALTILPSFEEVKIAVFNLNNDGAPRPDGFCAYFFNIIGILLVTMFFMLSLNSFSRIGSLVIITPIR
jgi:hypothetical protein